MRSGRWSLGAWVIFLGVTATWPAFTSVLSATGLTLEEVVERTLESNVDIRLAASQVRAEEGNLLVARSLFDPLFTVSGSRSRNVAPSLSDAADTTIDSAFSIGWSQRLRSGFQIEPSLSLNHTDTEGTAASPVATSSLQVEVSAPLLRDRWGKIGRLTERAAEATYHSTRWSLSHQQAVSVFEAIVAYWNYLEAQQNLEVFRLAEERAADLVHEMEQLVEASERPAANLIQVGGNAASKRIDRIAAEQRVIATRRQLGLAMGLPGDEISALPDSEDGFPPSRTFVSTPEMIEELIDMALERRADLESSQSLETSAELLVEAATDGLRPDLELSLSTGYSGIDAGSGLGAYLGALGHDISGLDARLLLSYQWPVRNRAARGSLMRSQSLYEQRQILRYDLERRVSSAVLEAVEALERGALRAREATQAVELNRTTVRNEKKKNRLGAATLLDVILAEDRLTVAQLGEVAARRAYAIALASLRFETATLVSLQAGVPTIDSRRWTVPPEPEREADDADQASEE